MDSAAPGKGDSAAIDQYKVRGMPHTPEDIVLCVDVDSQVNVVAASKLTRLDALKQALLLFVHSKLAMSPQHRFAIATIGESASWLLHQFSHDIDSIYASIRSISYQGSYPSCDLSSLFELILPEARASKSRGRSLRLIFCYCRSDVIPSLVINFYDNQKDFMLDVLYLHDKPNLSNNPQAVYDVLVEIVDRVNPQGYIFESGSGLSRVLFRHICQLLAHPDQRPPQDDFVLKDVAKSVPVGDGAALNQLENLA